AYPRVRAQIPTAPSGYNPLSSVVRPRRGSARVVRRNFPDDAAAASRARGEKEWPPRVRAWAAVAPSGVIPCLLSLVPNAEARGPWRGIFWLAQSRRGGHGGCRRGLRGATVEERR